MTQLFRNQLGRYYSLLANPHVSVNIRIPRRFLSTNLTHYLGRYNLNNLTIDKPIQSLNQESTRLIVFNKILYSTYLRGSSFVGGKSNIGIFTFLSLAHCFSLFTNDTLESSLGIIGGATATAE